MRSSEKILRDDGMMEWRDETNGIEEDVRMVRNHVIRKSGNDERLFEEKIKNLKS